MNDGIVQRALGSLGKGFDLCSDFRLKFCKGKERLILLNETDTRELSVPGFGSFHNVSIDIKCDKGERTRYQSDILEFNQMSEFFNQKCSVPGKIPSGLFNSMFGFQSGSWAIDAANTKYLGLDGYFIVLFNVHVDRYPLILADHVRNDVPSTWDPSALARFIEKYGTHIIVGLSIGGQDVVLVKQDRSSNMEPSQIKNHLDNLGDQLFTGTCTFSPHQCKTKEKTPQAFNVFVQQSNPFSNFASFTAKDGISVTCSKRGGDLSVNSHCEWLLTVPSLPDAIHFNFIPITSLLRGVPGKGFLSHAINLYLRYKPPIADLEYFLDFQSHRVWAPIHNDLPLGPVTKNKAFQTSALHFNFMGPKLYVNNTQIAPQCYLKSENKSRFPKILASQDQIHLFRSLSQIPKIGYCRKQASYWNAVISGGLAIHLQHLVSPPVHLQDKINEHVQIWRGSDQVIDNHLFFEPIQWKKFSHICTAPVKYDPKWLIPGQDTTAYIVTGAQLQVKSSVLHLRLSFSTVANCYVVQSNWMQCASSQNLYNHSIKSGNSFFALSGSSGNTIAEKEKQAQVINVDSGVYPTGPPVPIHTQKLFKFVDTSQLSRGPLDSPGHWLVTGAKLDLEKGKICLRVKFSLLNICSS